ncbi:MAG TPA: amino acid adenylation domain-containing protein [Thermoanaerobaculia bacterium]|nr:amino acid adenylation domain-containing protein [Thermoanaerobaculia bacterium]
MDVSAPPAAASVVDRLRARRRAAAPDLIARQQRDPRGTALSFAQQRLWFMEQLQTGTSVFNIAATLRLVGRLDVAALARAFAEMAARHEAVRTTFAIVDERPVQVISAKAAPRLAVVDLTPLPADAAAAEAHDQALAEAARPFDLERGPLLRLTLLRLPGEQWLLLTMHHLVSDGWSMAVLLREVIASYRGFVGGGRTAPVAELPIQYADFALWQRGWLQGEILEGHLAFWRERLAGSPAVLQMPADRARPPAQSFRGARYDLLLPQAVTGPLAQAARRQGTTLFTILLAALAVLLHRWSGEIDLVIGTPIANRRRTEVRNLIGLFVNMLAVRVDLGGQPLFHGLLRSLHDGLLEAHAHQELPFERLVEELRPERTASHAPLFQVVFAYQNVAMPRLELPGLAVEPLTIDPGTAMFDLTLNLEERPDGLAGWWEYSSDLFDRLRIVRLAAHFENLVAAIGAGAGSGSDTGIDVDALPMLSPGELRQVTAEWNDTRCDAPAATLHGLFAAQAQRTPHAVAVRCEDAVLSYAGLNVRADRLARRLRSLGVGPEVVVGVYAERSLALIVGVLAVLQAGGAYLPLDPANPAERLEFVLGDAGAGVVVAEERLAGHLPAHAATVVAVHASEAAPSAPPAPAEERRGARAPAAAGPENLANVIYTSGSTGRPKGAMNTHGAVVNRLVWMQSAYRLGPADAVLHKTPFGFDVSVWELFWPLATGAQLVMALPGGHQDPDYLAATIARQRISTLHFVPSMLAAFLEAEGLDRCRDLRRVIASGEALPADLAASFFSRLPWVELHNLYGPTEAAIDVTAWPCERDAGARPVPIGRPIANLRIHLLTAGLAPVPSGALGELCIAGAGVARGYLGRADLTAERFLPDPFAERPGARMYRTGDLARFRADGAVEYLGRADHQVKIRGFRIEPGEIEAALERCPGVRSAVVLARSDAAGSPRLAAYVVPADGVAAAETSAAKLAAALAASLPAYMVPADFVFLAALPLNANGKVDRRALPPPDAAAAKAATAYLAPRSQAEEVLCGIWAEVLGLPRIGVHDNFFALGGHSLLAPRTVSRLRRSFGVEVPLRALFDRPTVAGLAALIEDARGRRPDGEPLLERRVQRGVPQPLSPAQLRFWLRRGEGRGTGNSPLGARLTGRLDAGALRRGLAEIVRRHEVLRSAFYEVDGEPIQAVREGEGLAWGVVDLSALGADRREEVARGLAALAGRHPFDLAREPLVRATLLRFAADDHALLLVKHHLVTDGWSEGVVREELEALYSAYARGEPSPLPELPIQYGDFAAWQREVLQGTRLAALLGYWEERLRGLRPLALPTDLPRPAVRDLRGGRGRRSLGAALSRDVRQLGRNCDASLFMTLLAAWQAVLSQWTGQQDVALTTNVANRDRVELEPMIGLFTNILALRTDLSGDPTFRELLGRVRETTLAAFAHQDLPFVEILNRLVPQTAGYGEAYNQLFPAGFVLQSVPSRPLSLPGLTVAEFPLSSGATPRDLILLAGEQAETVELLLLYRLDILLPATVDTLLARFAALLTAAVRDPDRRLSRLAGPPAPEDRWKPMT